MDVRALFGFVVVAGLATGCSTGSENPTGAGGAGGSGSGSNAKASAGSGEGGDVLSGVASGTATGTGVGGGCAGVSQTAENLVRPVDIIWAVDTSDSMVSELQATQDNLNVFAQTILSAGIDVHVVLIAKPGKPDGGSIFNPDPGMCIGAPLATGSCPGGSKPPTYQHVEDGVGSNNALNKFIQNYPTYKPTLRQNSVKYFAVVTDDDATDGPNDSAAAFIANVDALDPGYLDAWKFFGIFCTGGCGAFLACADTGDVYNQLVAQKGGIAGDLCGGNSNGFASVFAALAQTVVESKELDCAWEIPPAPVGQTFDAGLVNVDYTPSNGPSSSIYHVSTLADCAAQGGWYYDNNASPTKVLVCPSTCTTIKADPSGKIDLVFGCATVDVPS